MTDLSQRLRLPTLGPLLAASERSARRFPLVLLSAALAATAGILLVNTSGDEESYVRLLATATLGLPLFMALTLTAERRFASPGDAARRWGLMGAGVVALAAFWSLWPRWPEQVQFARYVQTSVAFHLLAAVLPYAGVAEPNGFWQYNRTLFVRILTAALFTGVLFAGLAVGLAALDKLLGVDVPNEAYARLWMLLGFVFSTWFFLGGIPADLRALERIDDVPAVLRVFTQYVLVPLVTVYLVILTLYLGKVVIVRQWPSGWIGYLVSSVATVGIFAWLLVWPLEERPEYRWVRTYTRGFYLALLPAIVMLWLAIGKRVAQYGVTEPRYFLIVLSLWWAGIAVYYTLGRSRSIKVIPATLCLLAVLTFAGPWGAYQVSLRSQRHRLDGLLARYGLHPQAPPPGAAAATRDVPFGDRKEIAATLRYLALRHDTKGLVARFGGSASSAAGSVEPRVRAIMAALGVAYVSERERQASLEHFSFAAERSDAPLRIDEYQYAVYLHPREPGDSLEIERGTFVALVKGRNVFRVTTDGRTVLEIPIQPALERAAAYRQRRDAYRLPAGVLRVEARADQAAGLLYLTSLFGTRSDSGWTVSSYQGDLFLRLK